MSGPTLVSFLSACHYYIHRPTKILNKIGVCFFTSESHTCPALTSIGQMLSGGPQAQHLINPWIKGTVLLLVSDWIFVIFFAAADSKWHLFCIPYKWQTVFDKSQWSYACTQCTINPGLSWMCFLRFVQLLSSSLRFLHLEQPRHPFGKYVLATFIGKNYPHPPQWLILRWSTYHFVNEYILHPS